MFKKFHANVIGKGGATLRKLREETDTKIELPGEKNDSDVIVITGKKENVQKARARIQAIEKEMVRKRKSSHLVRFLCVSVFFGGGGGGGGGQALPFAWFQYNIIGPDMALSIYSFKLSAVAVFKTRLLGGLSTTYACTMSECQPWY